MESDTSRTEAEDREIRAACLINPASGLANDYLNIFNEILLLIENLPVLLPDMLAELESWEPVTYREYFSKSPLPGSERALVVYDQIEPSFREEFEARIARVEALAREGKQLVNSMRDESGLIEPDAATDTCARIADKIRTALKEATDLVNNGTKASEPCAQMLADRLMHIGA